MDNQSLIKVLENPLETTTEASLQPQPPKNLAVEANEVKSVIEEKSFINNQLL